VGHLKVLLNGKTSILPMHSRDLKKALIEGIKKRNDAKLELSREFGCR